MLGRLSGLKLIIIMILQLFLRARRLPNIARPLGEPAKAFHKSFKKGDGQQLPAGANNLEGHGRL